MCSTCTVYKFEGMLNGEVETPAMKDTGIDVTTATRRSHSS